MTDYRPLLTKIVRLADRGTFQLTDDWRHSAPDRIRWEATCDASGIGRSAYGRSPGIAVRKLLALLEKGRRS